MFERDQEILPGIALRNYPGHTRAMMAVLLASGGKTACYISDLIPSSAHLDLTWGMAYDLFPLETIANKKRFYAEAVPGNWLVLFTHDQPVAPAPRTTTSSAAQLAPPAPLQRSGVGWLRRAAWGIDGKAAYALDGGEFVPIFPDDGLFDTPRETITIKLPDLKPGTHVLMVRATDAAGNTGTGDAVLAVR